MTAICMAQALKARCGMSQQGASRHGAATRRLRHSKMIERRQACTVVEKMLMKLANG